MTYKAFLFLTVITLLYSSCSKAQTGRHNLILESSFEGAKPFLNWTNNQHCCDYSLQQSTKQASRGKSSLRLNVRASDPQVSSSIRSELVQGVEPLGTERWYGFNMYLENWGKDNAGEHVFQWHPDSPGGSAVGALWTSGGRFEFVTTHMRGNSGRGNSDLGPIISNQWIAWVIHVKWSDKNDGILQIWKDGKLLVDSRNIMTGPPMGNYFKLGINKFGWGIQPSTSSERTLYFDEVRIGNEKASYDDVKPGP